MREGARTSVMAGAWLCLALLGGCRGDDAQSAEAPGEATSDDVESFDPALAANLPPNTSEEQARRGRELFIVCAACHGLDARGTELGPSLRDPEWIAGSGTHEEIQAVIRTGVPEPEEFPIPMPAGGGGTFDAEQVRDLAAYVFALSRTP